MENKKDDNENTEAKNDSVAPENKTETAGDKFWKRLEAKGYSSRKVRQAFVMAWSPPKNTDML